MILVPRISSCAARLSAALHVRRMKQVELCDRTGIPKSAMSQYLKGSFEPKQNRLEAMAHVLSVNEAWLMGYDVPMEQGGEQGLGEVRSPLPLYKALGEGIDEGFEVFLKAFVEETKDLSVEGRNKLLELAKFFRQEEKRNKYHRD